MVRRLVVAVAALLPLVLAVAYVYALLFAPWEVQEAAVRLGLALLSLALGVFSSLLVYGFIRGRGEAVGVEEHVAEELGRVREEAT